LNIKKQKVNRFLIPKLWKSMVPKNVWLQKELNFKEFCTGIYQLKGE